MRRSFARFLRKLADFVDPQIGPCPRSQMVIELSCDASRFEEAMRQAMRSAERLKAAMPMEPMK